jgi:hypothetical protein
VTERRDEPGIANRERERTVELLREHTVAGTLASEELDERTRMVLTARTRAELERATHDLPPLPQPPLAARLAGRVPLRAHVVAYVVANAVFVAVWLATRDPDTAARGRGFAPYWPFWIMVFWGFALVAHALLSLRRPAVRRAERRRERAGRA